MGLLKCVGTSAQARAALNARAKVAQSTDIRARIVLRGMR
jgi:hypothetical protein